MDFNDAPRDPGFFWISHALLAAFAAFVFLGHMVPALIFGMLVYFGISRLGAWIDRRIGGPTRWALPLATALVLLAVLAVFAGLVFAGTLFGRNGEESVAKLLEQMAEVLSRAQLLLPQVLVDKLPQNAVELKAQAADYLRAHSHDLQRYGRETLATLVHAVLAVAIAAFAANHRFVAARDSAPLAAELKLRVQAFADAFGRVFVAQIRISAINTLLTAAYLLLILPSQGVHLPYVKTMILVTFVAGLIPVLGNILSNCVIVLISLGHSFATGLVSLVYLVVIHKGEYFLNARIIGTRIQSAAWELLLAMLVMEALFGIPGMLMAPVLYAYIKAEFGRHGLT